MDGRDEWIEILLTESETVKTKKVSKMERDGMKDISSPHRRRSAVKKERELFALFALLLTILLLLYSLISCCKLITVLNYIFLLIEKSSSSCKLLTPSLILVGIKGINHVCFVEGTRSFPLFHMFPSLSLLLTQSFKLFYRCNCYIYPKKRFQNIWQYIRGGNKFRRKK